MNKMKWYWWLLIAILIVILVIVILNYNNPKQSTVVPGASRISNSPRPVQIIVRRNTQDDNPNGISFLDPNALTDSNGNTAQRMGDKYFLNGMQVVKVCKFNDGNGRCSNWVWG